MIQVCVLAMDPSIHLNKRVGYILLYGLQSTSNTDREDFRASPELGSTTVLVC